MKLSLITILFIIMSTTVFSQEVNDSKPDKISLLEKELQEQKRISQLQKEIADNRKVIIENQRNLSKAFTLEPHEGTSTVQGQFIEGLILADESLSIAFAKVVEDMAKQENFREDQPINLVLYDKNSIDLLTPYQAFLAELDLSISELSSVKNIAKAILDQQQIDSKYMMATAGVLTLMSSTYGLLQAAGAIASAFKTDVNYQNNETTFSQEKIASALKLSAAATKWNIYAPSIFPIVAKSEDIKNSSLTKKLNTHKIQANESRAINLELVGKIERLKAEREKANDNDKADFDKLISEHQYAQANLNVQLALYDTLKKRLYSGQDGDSLFFILAAVESVANLLLKAETYVINFHIEAKTGYVTRQGWFVGNKNRLEHSGGVVVRCLIFDNRGKIIYTTVHSAYARETAGEFSQRKN